MVFIQILRLFEIVHILLNEKVTTAKNLSEKLEVSTRTIYRDVELLNSAGIPVYATKGKNGGIAILNNYVLNKSLLSEQEQKEILFALKSFSATQQQDSNKVLTKLENLFNKNEENWLEVDFSCWYSVREDKVKFSLLKQAILNHNVISFNYFNSELKNSLRKVKPLKLIFKSVAWYLQGYCINKRDYRTFKLNRIKDVKILPEIFERNNYFVPELEKIPEENMLQIELKFLSSMAHAVYDCFYEQDINKDKDGSFLVKTKLPDNMWLYSFILSFGECVEVIAPKDIREKFQERLENIKKIYV